MKRQTDRHRFSKRSGTPPPFEGKIRNWGLAFLRRNAWKVAAMCDGEDLQQEAFMIYWRIRTKHPRITDLDEFLRMYKVGLRFYLVGASCACFPNPYNMGQEAHCSSLTAIDGGDLTDLGTGAVCSFGNEVDDYLGLLQKLPAELQAVFMLLIREFLGLENIPIRESRRLNGRLRREPFEFALARRVGCPPTRDLVSEIAYKLGIVDFTNREEELV